MVFISLKRMVFGSSLLYVKLCIVLEREQVCQLIVLELSVLLHAQNTQKEITRQTDEYLVILFSKTYVLKDNLTKY